MGNVADYPRKKAVSALMRSVSKEAWEKNKAFTDKLREKIQSNVLAEHPVIEILNRGDLSKSCLQEIHMEYREAIVKVFTDALCMAIAQTRQLEPRLPPGSKMPPRFLLTLNTLDEFGFLPGLDAEGYYKGNPDYAHYPLFEDVLGELGITNADKLSFIASQEAVNTREYLENHFHKYHHILLLLAIAETQVIIFSPPLKAAAERKGINITSGYYNVHGTTYDKESDGADDDHEDDLWASLNQALTPADYDEIERVSSGYLTLWNKFWDKQMIIVAKHTSNTDVGII